MRQQNQSVDLVTLSDGPMVGWLENCVDIGHFSILDRAHLRHKPFEERVSLAQSFLEKKVADIVYVNSLAASEFLVAAKMTGKKAVLHLHEKKAEMRNLLGFQFTKINILSYCDAIVLAGQELVADALEVFGVVPQPTLDWGIALDFDEIIQRASEDDVIAKSAGDELLNFGNRLLVGMVGYGSMRKGADIFYELAKLLPQHDFIWVGQWDDIDVPFYDEFIRDRLANFFVSGQVDNPYKYIKQFDLFFLSSREDPNPIVLAEAMLLEVPVLCFSSTTSVRDFLGRNAILIHGNTNLEDAAVILNKIDKAEVGRGGLTPVREVLDEAFNVKRKISSIIQLLEAL